MKKIFCSIILLLNISFNALSQDLKYQLLQKLNSWGKIELNSLGMNKISLSKDAKYLAALGDFGVLLIWDYKKGEIKYNLTESAENRGFNIRDIDYSNDGKLFAAVGTLIISNDSSNKYKEEKLIRIYETSTYKIIKELKYDTIADIYSCIFSNDSKYLIVCDNSPSTIPKGTFRVYESLSLKEKSNILLNDIAFSINKLPNSSKFVVLNNSNEIHILDYSKGRIKLERSINLEINCSEFSISNDGKTIALSGDNILFYSLTNNESSNITHPKSNLYAIDFGPNDEFIGVGGDNNECYIYDLKKKEIAATLSGDKDNPFQNEDGYNFTKAIFSEKGEYIFMINDAGFIYVFAREIK